MNQKRDNTDIKYSGILFSITVLSVISLFWTFGRNGFSDQYKTVYIIGGSLTIILMFGVIVLTQIKSKIDSRSPMSLIGSGFIAETHPLRLFSNFPNIIRFGIPILWGLILLFLALAQFQIIGVPTVIEPFAQSQPGEFAKVYYSSVPVALIEDFLFLVMVSSLVTSLVLTLFSFTRLKVGLGIVIISMIIGSFVGSNAFVLAHQVAYQDNDTAYISAMAYAFPSSMIYQVTGVFLPIAHVFHNAGYVISSQSGLQIGGFA